MERQSYTSIIEGAMELVDEEVDSYRQFIESLSVNYGEWKEKANSKEQISSEAQAFVDDVGSGTDDAQHSERLQGYTPPTVGSWGAEKTTPSYGASPPQFGASPTQYGSPPAGSYGAPPTNNYGRSASGSAGSTPMPSFKPMLNPVGRSNSVGPVMTQDSETSKPTFT